MDDGRSTPLSDEPEHPVAAEATGAAGVDFMTLEAVDGSVLVHVRGDIDAVAAPDLRSTLLDVIGRRPERVRLDMAGVEFLDSVGISALVVAYNRAEEAGVAFELTSV